MLGPCLDPVYNIELDACEAKEELPDRGGELRTNVLAGGVAVAGGATTLRHDC